MGDGDIEIDSPTRRDTIAPPELWATGRILAPEAALDAADGRPLRFTLRRMDVGDPQRVKMIGAYIDSTLFVPSPNHSIEGAHHILQYEADDASGLVPDYYLGMQDVGLHKITLHEVDYFLMQSELGTWAKHCKDSGQIRFQGGYDDAAVFRLEMMGVIENEDQLWPGIANALVVYEVGSDTAHTVTKVGCVVTSPEGQETRLKCVGIPDLPNRNNTIILPKEEGEFAKIKLFDDGKSLPDFAHVRFPKTPKRQEGISTSDPNAKADAAARFIENIKMQGVPASASDELDIARLQRHHVRAASLALPRDEDHRVIHDLLMMQLDIREDMDTFFRRISSYLIGRFAMQHAVVDEVYNMLAVDPDEEMDVEPVDFLDVLETFGTIAAGFDGTVNLLISVISLAVEIVESNQPATRQASVHGTVADLIREIQDEYLKISYGLEELRDRNVVSMDALRAWKETVGTSAFDTAALDASINTVFRRHVTSRLLRIGCRLKQSHTGRKISRYVDPNNPTNVDIAGYYRQVNEALSKELNNKPYLVAISIGAFKSASQATEAYQQAPVYSYELVLRHGAMRDSTKAYIFSVEGFSRHFLWHEANIPCWDIYEKPMAKPGGLTEPLAWPPVLP